MKSWLVAAIKWLAERLLFVALGFGAAWFIQEANQRADEIEDVYWSTPDTTTHQTPVTNIPPTTGKPNPAPAKPRPDLTDKRRIDSLTHSGADKDSVINVLSEARFVQQTFRTQKDSTTIVGRLDILYFPLDAVAITDVFVDSLSVPERVITIIKTVEKTRVDWGWTAAIAATAVIVIEGVLYYLKWLHDSRE